VVTAALATKEDAARHTAAEREPPRVLTTVLTTFPAVLTTFVTPPWQLIH
jgi:hypothetical protein